MLSADKLINNAEAASAFKFRNFFIIIGANIPQGKSKKIFPIIFPITEIWYNVFSSFSKSGANTLLSDFTVFEKGIKCISRESKKELLSIGPILKNKIQQRKMIYRTRRTLNDILIEQINLIM